ncbi:Unknown protein [Striga hermonthica]|uniref:Uncharacterized protein n=1 Tax=Striga hermonthica TaxID=68872 RepID=A0A9N7MRU1_STRHE|nr:Unknown protein [Striga hermonthica]
MLHESAAFSVVLSHSCPPRRATRSVVLSHKISTSPPAGRANRSSLPQPSGFARPLQDSGSARESAGNNRKEGVHVAAAPAPFLVNGAQQVRHLLQKRESTSDNHASARQRVEWARADLFGYIIQVESRVTGTAV